MRSVSFLFQCASGLQLLQEDSLDFLEVEGGHTYIRANKQVNPSAYSAPVFPEDLPNEPFAPISPDGSANTFRNNQAETRKIFVCGCWSRRAFLFLACLALPSGIPNSRAGQIDRQVRIRPADG